MLYVGYLEVLGVLFSSVAQSCLTLCDPVNSSTPGLPIHHQLPEFTQTHIHRVSDAIQSSHPLSSPSPLAPNRSQHQSLFQWVNSSHEVAKVLEFQYHSASVSFLPKKSQDWSPSEWTFYYWVLKIPHIVRIQKSLIRYVICKCFLLFCGLSFLMESFD